MYLEEKDLKLIAVQLHEDALTKGLYLIAG
jgi:hypothetical protein